MNFIGGFLMPGSKSQQARSNTKAAAFFNDALDRAKKIIDKTTTTAEEQGKKALKFTEEVAENAVKKIKEIGHIEPEALESPSKGKKPLSLKLPKGVAVEKHLETLAADIYSYLGKNGDSSIDKIVNVMKRRKNTQVMVLCAIGWLLHDNKLKVGAGNTTLAIKQKPKKPS